MKNAAVAILLCAVGAGGCVSARMSDHEPDRMFWEGRYDDAAEKFRQGYEKQGDGGKDSLLYLFDLGLSLHAAGKHEDSVKSFLRADQLSEIKDYTSLAAETATLLTSDNIKSYKAEDFEYVLISTYLAMDYALMGKTEDALVEARRVNRKLHMMVTEGKRKYKQNAFARYLSAILYESEKDYNGAYIDYKFTRDLDPDVPGLGRDLWRMAWKLRMPDEMERWQKEFSLTEEDKKRARELDPRNGKGEIIVLYENGISPIKRPNPDFYSLPKFYPRYNPIAYSEVLVNGNQAGTTYPLYNIEEVAIQNLDEKYGGMIAKKIGGIVAKEVVADQIERRTNSPLAGLIARVAFYASDQADLRSWNLLPKDLQLARLVVEPGVHTVRLHPVGAASPLPEKTVQVEAGKKVFVNFRYTPKF